MKIAVISDIHGNLPALNAVLADAEKQGVAEYVFAGDYCLSGPFPDDCVTAIRQIENKHVIRGNEELFLENLIGKDQGCWTDGQMQISYWCFRNICPENLRYLMELPHTLEFTCNGIPCLYQTPLQQRRLQTILAYYHAHQVTNFQRMLPEHFLIYNLLCTMYNLLVKMPVNYQFSIVN